MEVTLILGLVASIAFLHLGEVASSTSTGYGHSQSNNCYNYQPQHINTNPWTQRRYYAVMVSQVKINNFWGNGDSCGVFNKCTKTACGCVGLDVYSVQNRYLEGAWFSYDKSKKIQYVRRVSATLPGNSGYGQVTFFFSHQVTWTVPEQTVKNVTCHSCGHSQVHTYTVPAQSVTKNLIAFKVDAILITVSAKYRILVFCGDLKGINDNKPFAVVLATMPTPGKPTWKEINAALRSHKFEPRNMVFVSHDRCVYPPFEWCSKLTLPKNPQCDICKYSS